MAFRTNKMPVLQEKSASGSVASFNTALAMPLSSCNIAVNAWQEGSGDPSPVNVRAIHGFSEVNATRCGKNLFDKTKVTYGKWLNVNTGVIENAVGNYCISDYIFVKGGTTYTMTSPYSQRRWFYSLDYQPLEKINSDTFTPSVDCYAVITISRENTSIDIFQLEVGSQATPFEPYVTPTIYTIQLGQEVYGAEVDAVNGVAHVTHAASDMGDLAWSYQESQERFYTLTLANVMALEGGYGNWKTPPVCEIYRESYNTLTNNTIAVYSNGLLYCVDKSITASSAFTTYVTGKKICYKLATPFDIQLTPTQIETLIGNNTIFADTGDVDLTYKDLDLAKRGSFREVFKLPS